MSRDSCVKRHRRARTRPREVVEAALAHTVQNPTEAAYARSDLFERRRRLMDDLAAYLSGAHGQVWHDDGNLASRPEVASADTITASV